MKRPRADQSTATLWIEEGDEVVGPVATVAIVGPIERTYAYRVEPALAARLTPGQRVLVPVGKRGRPHRGFCVSVDHRPWDSTLRPIGAILDGENFLSADLLQLGQWISRHYGCPLGRTLSALVSEDVRKKSGFVRRRLVRAAPDAQVVLDSGRRLGPKQRVVLQRLTERDGPIELDELLKETEASQATIRALASRGWITIDVVRAPSPPPDFDRPSDEPEFTLNEHQGDALRRVGALLDAGAFRVALLYGVSGSGKTEVYVRAIRRVLTEGRQAILLVPEIALTTQLVHRLASRFTDVAVVHSGLTGSERSLTWTAVRARQKQVVIGTRSAVFAPCPNLGLIVVDEEQESSYKNLQAPRFHVRDVAIKRAQQLGIPILLGSATPSLESWHNCARFAHFERIDLPRRVRDLPLPQVTVVDMNEEYQEKSGLPLLSRITVRWLEETFENKQQAVLLMNRRGYAPSMICPSCRQRIVCPDCNLNMVYHAARGEMLCHRCAQRSPAPERCPNPSCSGHLVPIGGGTQRIEERLRTLFPDARVARIDSDTMRHPRAYRQAIEDFEQRRTDCLVGTQMIAKGLDFPHVAFVAVLYADALASPQDFRADERLFQLIIQVAGRAGRADTPGRVVVQTTTPGAPALQAAVRHDYATFAEQELAVRRRHRLPPFTRLTRIVLADRKATRLRNAAALLAGAARRAIKEHALDGADVLGPAPCVLPRLRGRYRFEVVLRSPTPEGMRALLDHLRADPDFRVRVDSITLDVDPVSMT